MIELESLTIREAAELPGVSLSAMKLAERLLFQAAHPSWSRPAPASAANAAPIRSATSAATGASVSASTTRTTSRRAGVIDTANRTGSRSSADRQPAIATAAEP